MPPRLAVLAILVFWIVATAWLFQRDLWPHLRPGEPPPYTIDLADEARQQGPPIHWHILRGENKVGEVETSIRYRPVDDIFDLQSRIARIDLGKMGPLQITATGIASTYSVTRSGELRELAVEGALAIKLPSFLLDGKISLEGKVERGYFIPKGQVESRSLKYDLPLEPVEVSVRGSILNPLHPVNRIAGLRRGQHWRMPLVDPLAESLSALAQKNPALEIVVKHTPRTRILEAEVLSDPVSLEREHRAVECLVIEYRENDFLAHTWVRASDGLVLRQEASVWGEQVVMERE